MELKQRLIFLFLISCSCTSIAKRNCTEATEYQPVLCPIQLPRIQSIKIEENGEESKDNHDTNCSVFKLTNRDVKRFFTKTWQLKYGQVDYHTLDWYPCSSSGTILFSNGARANWNINQSKSGGIIFNNKEINLYCPDCKFKPFLW